MATSLGNLTAEDRVPRAEAALLAGLGVLAGVLIGWSFGAPQLEVDVINVQSDCNSGG